MRLSRFSYIAIFAILNPALLAVRQAENNREAARATAERLAALSAADLGQDQNAGIGDLAIAPDGSAFVVKFAATTRRQDDVGLFLGLWSLPEGKPLVNARFAMFRGWTGDFGRGHEMEFSPDGTRIIMADRSTIYIADARTLKLLNSIQLPSTTQYSKRPPFVRAFSISGDSTTLVVLSGDGPFAPGPDLVQVFRLATAEEIGRWKPAEKLKSVSVSKSGDLLLANMWAPRRSDDVLLMEAATGKLVQHLRSGYAYGQGYSTLAAAMFLDRNRFVAVPDRYVDENGKYPDRIRVLDSSSGNTLQDLVYNRFGPTGILAISGDQRTIVAFNYPVKHGNGAQLLFYHPSGKTPYCVLDPVPEKESNGKGSGYVRFSSDPAFWGVFTTTRLGIYKVSNCNSTASPLS